MGTHKKYVIGLLATAFVLSLSVGAVTLNTASAENTAQFAMIDGASVRTDDPAGIRFVTVVNDEYKATLSTNYDYVWGTKLTFQPVGGESYTVEVDTEVWTDDTKTKWNTVLLNVPDTDYLTQITAESYVKGYAKDDTEKKTIVFSDTVEAATTRSIAWAASWALNDGYTQSILSDYVGAVETTVTLDKPSLSMLEEETATLTATVEGDYGVVWTSSDKDVATVDKTGKVTAVGEGTATITASVGNNQATCAVTVALDPSKYYTTEENVVYGSDGDMIKGTKYSSTALAATAGYYVPVKENVALEGELMKMAFVIADPSATQQSNYEWKYAWIKLNDRATGEEFILRIYLPDKAFSWSNTGIGWEYGGNSQSCVQAIAALNVATTVLTLTYDETQGLLLNGKTLNKILTAANQTAYGKNPGVLTGFGEQGVDISIMLDGKGSYIVGETYVDLSKYYTTEENVTYGTDANAFTGTKYSATTLAAAEGYYVGVKENATLGADLLEVGFVIDELVSDGNANVWRHAWISFKDRVTGDEFIVHIYLPDRAFQWTQFQMGWILNGTEGQAGTGQTVTNNNLKATSLKVAYDATNGFTVNGKKFTKTPTLPEGFGVNGVDISIRLDGNAESSYVVKN